MIVVNKGMCRENRNMLVNIKIFVKKNEYAREQDT